MLKSNKIAVLVLTGLTLALAVSCRKDYNYEPPAPHTSQPALELNAGFVTTPPNMLSSAYWSKADYLKVVSQDISMKQLYGDGLLNMTGTFLGLVSFNNGADPGLTMKAAYDNENLYILAEWTDPTVDPEFARWFYNGPTDPLKPDTTGGWTQQGNCDRFAMAFEIQNASSSAGSFSTAGCKAACHTNSDGTVAMHPDAGTVDIWNWNLAHSAPLGYAEDMVANSTKLSYDSGQKMWVWNRNAPSARSGPAYEWDGSSQNISLANGQSSILNNTFYLYNKTQFKGDANKGAALFNSSNHPGDCQSCHGANGTGGSEEPLNGLALGAESRTQLITGMNNVADMGPYISGLGADDFDNLVAYIKGISGAVPGSFLQEPSGSNADITVISNVTPAQIANAANPSKNKHTTYKILIIRKLKTGNTDDIQFDPLNTKTYKFGVALMNKDGKNQTGSTLETLNFK